eukprot:1539639-Heterocapsa_arctica.AAC.1
MDLHLRLDHRAAGIGGRHEDSDRRRRRRRDSLDEARRGIALESKGLVVSADQQLRRKRPDRHQDDREAQRINGVAETPLRVPAEARRTLQRHADGACHARLGAAEEQPFDKLLILWETNVQEYERQSGDAITARFRIA